MPNFASVTLIGHLGRDPETKSVGSDTVTSFSLATNRKRKDGDLSTWWNCSMWGDRGKRIAQYLGKGDPILIVGEPFQRPYTTRDGRDGVALEVDVRDWSFVGSKGDQGASGSSGQAPSRQRPAASQNDVHAASQSFQAPGGADYDDDIPFEAYQARWVA